MQFPNSDVREVLNLYERLTGKKLVFDNTVQGPVNIVLSQPVSREEAIKIIEINLLLNGFSLVPADNNITKVIGLTKNPRTAGVPIFSDAQQIPDGDQIITFLFKLQNADPTELQQTLAQYIAPQLYTSIVALPKSQALLVTESSSVIRGLQRIINEIDKPPAEVVSEFIQLERADAKDVLEKLNGIFEKSPSPSGGPGINVTRPARNQLVVEGQPPAPQPDSGNATFQIGSGLSEDSIIIGKIRLTADVRTNRIHVITRPINLPFVRKLIQEFDSDIPFGEPTTRPLRFVSAGDVLQVVVKAITEPGMKAEDANAAAGTPGRPAGAPANAPRSGGSGFGGNSGGGTSAEFSVSEGLSTEPVDTTPEAVTIGNTKIIADKRANAIIVLGNKQVKEKIFKVLDQIDVRAPQVLLNTVIGELTLDNSTQLGVDYFVHTGRGAGRGNALPSGSPSASGLFTVNSSGQQIFDIGSILTSQNFKRAFAAGASGLTGFVAAGNSLDILVNALEATNRFRVTQRPMIFTSNNKKAIIASGEEIAVPTQTLTSFNGSSNSTNPAVSSSVEFKRVALQLEVVPLINADREVSLDILQKLDNVEPGKSTVVGGSNIPTISTRYIKTNVSVPNEATIVLGGLIKQDSTNSNSGIPYLSRIPVLGSLFKTTSHGKSRSELIILMRPVVTTKPTETLIAREKEQQHLVLEPDIETTLDPKGARVETSGSLLRAPKPELRPEK